METANDSGNSYWNWHPVEGYSGACVPYYTRQSGINASKAGSWKADAQWEFTNLAPAGTSIACTVSAYIPNTPRADAEALYSVYDRPGENAQDLLGYQWIIQNQYQGSLVQITGQSSVTFTTGYLDLVIANPNNTTSGDQKTIVADAAKINCG